MLKDIAEAMLGRRPFDLIIRNVQIVNVFSASIVSGSIGIVNGHIAGVFGPEEALDSRRSIDGGNAYALPGFVDSHMHLESSMLTPEHFAQVALSCGTTTVCADPHEIANVLGIEGVRGLADACRSLPLRVLTVCFYNSPPSFRASIHNSNNFYTIFLCQTLARTFLRTFCSFCVFSLREFTCLRHEQCWLAGGRFFPCWRLSNSD